MATSLFRRAAGVAAWSVMVAAPFAAQAQIRPEYGHGHWNDGWGWGHMIFGPVMFIVFIAIAAAVVVLIVRWLGGPHAGAGHHAAVIPGRAPLDILKERFARGEIDAQEFEERRRILGE